MYPQEKVTRSPLEVTLCITTDVLNKNELEKLNVYCNSMCSIFQTKILALRGSAETET